jgi:hypothetical protein
MTAPEANVYGRHVYGPRPIGGLIPAVARATFRSRAPATAQVLADWGTIVGPALAAVTTPRRLSAGTLTVACAGPVAMELQYISGQLIERINTCLGHSAVLRLRFQQTPPAARTVPLAASPTDPALAEAARARTSGMADGPLRDALIALGTAVLAQSTAKPVKR